MEWSEAWTGATGTSAFHILDKWEAKFFLEASRGKKSGKIAATREQEEVKWLDGTEHAEQKSERKNKVNFMW